MKWIFKRGARRFDRQAKAGGPRLDDVLMELAPGVLWTVRDSLAGGVLSLGTTGSGKTSGSLRAINSAQLESGFGGIYFTVKPEDRHTYEQWIKDAGRTDDLVVVSQDGHHRFNFLQAEISQCPNRAAAAQNLTQQLLTAAEACDPKVGPASGGGDDSAFFRHYAAMYLNNALWVLLLSGSNVTPQSVLELIRSTPRSDAELNDAAWRARSHFFRAISAAQDAPMTESEHADFRMAAGFFLRELVNLGSRTRSSVEATLTAALNVLSRGLVRETISAERPNLQAESVHEGKLVIVDFPVHVYGVVGKVIQVMLKDSFQRAHSRRTFRDGCRPTFMLTDECQYLLVAADQLFQSTTRSTGTSVTNATQSVSAIAEALGADSETKVAALLGNFSTQVFHAQTDTRTIEYIQQLVGRSRQFMMNGNSARGGEWLAPLFGESTGGSAGFSEAYEFELQARDLNGLAKGGPPRFITEAIVYQSGRTFPNGRTWLPVQFNQKR